MTILTTTIMIKTKKGGKLRKYLDKPYTGSKPIKGPVMTK